MLQFLQIVVAALLCVKISALNILLLARNDLDVLYQFRHLSDALADLGHRVTIIADSANPEINFLFRGSKTEFMYHHYGYNAVKDSFDYLYTDEKFEATYVEKVLKKEFTEECMKVIYSDDLHERIRLKNFHLAVVDSVMFCYHILPYRLQIPFISMGTVVYPYLMRMHPLLSVEPCLMKEDAFFSRIYRLVSGIYGEITPKLLIDESQFAHAVPDRLFYSLREIAGNSSLWFVLRDQVLNCPLPVSPGVIQLNPFLIENQSEHNDLIQEFTESNSRILVVIWFSHSLRNLTATIQDKFSATFRKSSQLFLWHRENTTLPENVRTIVNVTLSELLSHPKTKLLISDCNTRAVSEAIYHAVPVLCMPVLTEHRYNAHRVVTKKIGMHLDIRKFRPKDLSKRIRSIVKGEKCRENIKRLSLVRKSLVNSTNLAAYWIDHILKFGSEHLRSSASHQSLFKFLMLDIYAAAFASSIMIAYLFKYAIKIVVGSIIVGKIHQKISGKVNSRKDKEKLEDHSNERINQENNRGINSCQIHHHAHHGNHQKRD